MGNSKLYINFDFRWKYAGALFLPGVRGFTAGLFFRWEKLCEGGGGKSMLQRTRANITVHHKCEDKTLDEVLPTSVGLWAGKSVDDKFIKFLSELVGETAWEEFKMEHKEEFLEIIQNIHAKKKLIKPNESGNTRIIIPRVLQDLSKKSHGVKTFNAVIQKKDVHRNVMDFEVGKLVLDNHFFRGFFKKTIDGIVKHIDEIFQESRAKDVKIIVMVGSFSRCLLVQDAIKKNFCNLSIIVPKQCELAVLKGAVYFGHISDAIPRRSARLTYGFQTWPEFNEDIHPEEKRVEWGKSSRCRDVFLKIVTKGDKIMKGFTKSQVFRVPYNRENVLECGLFISEKKNLMFVDDPDCKLLGTLQVPFSPNKQNSETLVEEKLLFGETELIFTAEDIYSGLKYEIRFDLNN
uniref:Heat shock 70 kDa protein 12B n=1 Tax=Magallana gigas TaxID=29159 RepID=A0A8W8L536_MAGGI